MSGTSGARPSPIYNRSFLFDELLRAATLMRRDEFVLFQTKMINQLVPDLQFHALSVNVFHINGRLLLDGEVTSATANTPRQSIDNYLKYQEFDDFSHITFLNPGAALFNDALKPMEEWLDHPIYRQHCTPYGHYWVLSIACRLPYQKMTFIAFDYLRMRGAPFELALTERKVEYISQPFYLGWLHVLGRISAEQLRDWLGILAGLSEPRFRLLRALSEPGISSAKQFAELVGIAPKTVYRHFEDTCENLYELHPDLAPQHGYANRELTLLRAYGFLSLGGGSLARNLPLRVQLG